MKKLLPNQINGAFGVYHSHFKHRIKRSGPLVTNTLLQISSNICPNLTSHSKCYGLSLDVPLKPRSLRFFRRWVNLEFVTGSKSNAGIKGVSDTHAQGHIACLQYRDRRRIISLLLLYLLSCTTMNCCPSAKCFPALEALTD